MRMKKIFGVICLALAVPALISCGAKKTDNTDADASKTTAKSPAVVAPTPPAMPAQLPVRFQSPSYVAGLDTSGASLLGEKGEEYQIKVGATIRSTGGPQPLWEVMKRLANLKNMTVSWASDVDQTRLVDVDIAANDNFFDAIANLLRQVDYFHESNGGSIVVYNKKTKVYQIGIPSMKGGYTTTVGGNYLSQKDASSGTEGTVKITSADNNFDIWQNIEANLKTLLQIAAAEQQEVKKAMEASAESDYKEGNKTESSTTPKEPVKESNGSKAGHSMLNVADGGSFVIDKSIGLISVTAKPSILKKVDQYIETLRDTLYKQVNIEAKIIEVYLQDNSKIGLDWDSVLQNFNISATTFFGNAGQVHPRTTADPDLYSNTFVSRVYMPSLTFNVFLNALKQQGDTQVLANPKLTVLNGQPALISVGKDVAYVKTVTRDEDTDTNEITYSAETGNVVQGIALGVMATIMDKNKVVLHLTPITTDIENLDANGDVPMTSIGDGAIELGLPHVKVRQMSTMVEVSDGEMLIIGGLIDSVKGKSGSFAPVVGDIPVLRYLFGYEEKTMQKRELVILLTPKIL